MNDILVWVGGLAAIWALAYGLWRAVRLPHAGWYIVAAGLIAVALLVSPRFFPNAPAAVVGAGFILSIVVTYAVIYWRHRHTDEDALEVATISYGRRPSRPSGQEPRTVPSNEELKPPAAPSSLVE